MTVEELAREGRKPQEIAEILGIALSTVYMRAKRDGVIWIYEHQGIRHGTPLAEQMREYKAEGKTNREVAEKFNVTRDAVKNICRGMSPPGNQYTNGSFDRTENAKRYIKERTVGFEYAGNFTGIDGKVDLKCKTCGTVSTKSFVTVKQGKARCQNCYNAAIEERRREKQQRKEQIEQEREEARKEKQRILEEIRAEKIKALMHNCPVCGEETTKPKYCSRKCRGKSERKRQEIKRRNKIEDAMVDKDITIDGLYKRDGGRCHICGMLCTWDDYIVRDGTIICGDWYPSIDHVIPLSRGGAHAWQNVRLAHRRCNSWKGDRVRPQKF